MVNQSYLSQDKKLPIVDTVFSNKRTSTNLRGQLVFKSQRGYICYSLTGLTMKNVLFSEAAILC